ncbi:MAG: nucleoside-diphosphate kinase [Proteobacteria bacterium]|nr:nucleoside-diphosphate kinase [Pseudomonadota bacterium]
MTTKAMEQTLVLMKPDCLKNSLTGYVLTKLSEYHAGLIYAGAKVVSITDMLASEHYAEHREKHFFPWLLKYVSGQVHFAQEPQKQRLLAFVFQGPGAVAAVREIAGPTNPTKARLEKPGSVRSLGTVIVVTDDNGKVIDEQSENLIHASANTEEAEREIKLWFTPQEIPVRLRAYETVQADALCYYKSGRALTAYEDGATCLFAPGDLVWASDLKIAKQHLAGEKADDTLELVAAKYLLNTAE